MEVHKHPDVLDQLILWVMDDPRYIEKQEPGKMHVQWTVQLRFDPIGDEEKKKYVTEAVKSAASYILAQANLLEGPVQSTIAVYSDDFMHARKAIELIPDTIGVALKSYKAEEQEGMSSEMWETVNAVNQRKRK